MYMTQIKDLFYIRFGNKRLVFSLEKTSLKKIYRKQGKKFPEKEVNPGKNNPKLRDERLWSIWQVILVLNS